MPRLRQVVGSVKLTGSRKVVEREHELTVVVMMTAVMIVIRLIQFSATSGFFKGCSYIIITVKRSQCVPLLMKLAAVGLFNTLVVH